MRREKALAALYRRIPAFECIPGCHDCCGVVPFAPAEWATVADRASVPTIEVPMPSGAAVHLAGWQ